MMAQTADAESVRSPWPLPALSWAALRRARAARLLANSSRSPSPMTFPWWSPSSTTTGPSTSLSAPTADVRSGVLHQGLRGAGVVSPALRGRHGLEAQGQPEPLPHQRLDHRRQGPRAGGPTAGLGRRQGELAEALRRGPLGVVP